MNQFLSKLHARVGDLWWYSAMIFLACRSGDAVQAFIGLWLVPKYVGPQELGAVLPLQQLSTFFAIPLAIIATVFAKYVNTYATRGEYGKVKSFIHDVLAASILVFAVCIAAAYFLLPHFYERLHVASGALTVLILASGFLANVSQLFSSALQGLKKFKAMTVMGVLAAPIRLVTLLVAMPFRALSGYVLGQTTPSGASTLVAAVVLKRDLRDVPADTSWRKDVPEILRYLGPYAICTIFGTLFGTITATVYRQRLPEVESAAYYMLSRFAEISGYVGSAMSLVLFPMASEAHEQGAENDKPLRQAIFGTAVVTAGLALAFAFLSKQIFSLTATWKAYADYAYLLAPMTIGNGISIVVGAIAAYEFACRRNGAVIALTSLCGIWTAFLVSFTGYEFFDGFLPVNIITFMSLCDMRKLSNITYCSIFSAVLQCVVIAWIFNANKHKKDICT